MYNHEHYANANHLNQFINVLHSRPGKIDALMTDFLERHDLELTEEQRLRFLHVTYDWTVLQADVIGATAGRYAAAMEKDPDDGELINCALKLNELAFMYVGVHQKLGSYFKELTREKV